MAELSATELAVHRKLARGINLATIYGAYERTREDLRLQLNGLYLGPLTLESDWRVMEILAALTHEKGAAEDRA